MPRAVVIGLDGVAWHLLDPLLEAGAMPRLKALRDRGAAGVLESTVPTYTPPAWTAAATGVNPGRHGIYGFVESNAQSDKQVLVHSGKIRSAPLWQMTARQGARAGIYNLPLTYPPHELDGWMVSGMLTPGYVEHRTRFTYPPGLETEILSWAPDYIVDLSANWERDWKDDALCHAAIDSLEQRRRVLEELLALDPVDVVFAVLETPDRLQHVYYGYMDPSNPLYDSDAGNRIRPSIAACFEAMDRIVGLLEDYTKPDGGVVLCSDHGFTTWETSVHTNALLEQWGYLRLKRGARALQTSVARGLVPVAKRVLPAKVARRAKGRTFAAVDWSRTKAFASPIPQQGIFVNVAGRERFGIVPPSDLDAVKSDLVRRFEALAGPDGRPVTDRVYRSEEVFHGEALSGAPDLLPVLRDHRFELDDELFHREPFSDQSHLPRGVHHPDGVIVVAGPGVAPGASLRGRIWDVTPTLLYLAGLGVPEGLDGRVLTEAFSGEHRAVHPVATTSAQRADARDESSPYSEQEEAMIEESLRGLGYL